MNYYSGDWHLGHNNIIRYDGRPFKSVDEMDGTILSNVRAQLKHGDNLYYVGDFALSKIKGLAEGYMKALADSGANLFFIRGNHDRSDTIKLYRDYGFYLGDMAEIQYGDQLIVLCHYAMRVWNKSHHGSWHLYGHSHHTLKEDQHSLSFDVGINGWNYKLVSHEQVEIKMAHKDYQPVDHHGKTGRL